MPTFLPFSRAVKARARTLGVCGALLGTGCVGGGATRHSEEPGSGPRPALTAVAVRGPDESPPADGDDGGQAPTIVDDGSPSAPSISQVTLDLPYPVDARPRAASPTEAAADDEAMARWNIGGSGDPTYPSSRASYHPGTRVVVDTRLAKHRAGNPLQLVPKRGLTLGRIEAQARSRGYWPFRLCFEAGQREKRSPGGETRVAFTVGTHGKVSRAWLLDSKLASPGTAACLLRETGKLEFTPRPARPLALVASIKLWPGDAELPPLPQLAAGVVSGGFDPEGVRNRVTSKLAELSACFADARRSDPALWGRLALAVILEVDGSVHRVSEVESHFPNAAAAHCVEIVLAGIPFSSVNGKPFTVVVPVRLSPPTPITTTGPDISPSPQEPASDAGSD